MMPGVFFLALFIPVGTFCGAIPSPAIYGWEFVRLFPSCRLQLPRRFFRLTPGLWIPFVGKIGRASIFGRRANLSERIGRR